MESSRVLTRRSASEVSRHRLYLSNSFRAWSRSSSNWVLGKFLVETIGNHAHPLRPVGPTHALCPFGLAIVVVASQRAGLGYSFRNWAIVRNTDQPRTH
jgi:hypothetical protein